jgi:hypothetical protein
MVQLGRSLPSEYWSHPYWAIAASELGGLSAEVDSGILARRSFLVKAASSANPHITANLVQISRWRGSRVRSAARMLSFANHANTLAMSMGRSPTDRSLDRQINSRNVSLFRRPDDNPQAIRLPGRRSSGLCQPLAAESAKLDAETEAARTKASLEKHQLFRIVSG